MVSRRGQCIEAVWSGSQTSRPTSGGGAAHLHGSGPRFCAHSMLSIRRSGRTKTHSIQLKPRHSQSDFYAWRGAEVRPAGNSKVFPSVRVLTQRQVDTDGYSSRRGAQGWGHNGYRFMGAVQRRQGGGGRSALTGRGDG